MFQPSNLLLTIGRAADNSYPIFHESVLPYHAEIYLIDGMTWLVDKSHGAKTWILSQQQWLPVLKAPVSHHAILRFGESDYVEVGKVLNKSGKNIQAYELERKCKVCNVREDYTIVSNCRNCEGAFVAEVLNKTVTTWQGDSQIKSSMTSQSAHSVAEGYKKRIRCLKCAAVFTDDIFDCPECGHKRVPSNNGVIIK